jgi:hypothetical protein
MASIPVSSRLLEYAGVGLQASALAGQAGFPAPRRATGPTLWTSTPAYWKFDLW